MEDNVLKKILDHIDISATQKKVLGFTFRELAIFGSIMITIGLNTASFVDIRSQTKWLIEFASNSDTYNSAVTGRQFKQGKPISDEYQIKRVTSILKVPVIDT